MLQDSLRRDVVVALLATAALYAVALSFDLGDVLVQVLIASEDREYDEIIVAALGLVPCLAAVVASQRRRVTAARLLQQRVEAEARANEALRHEIDQRHHVEHSLEAIAAQAQAQLSEITTLYDTAPIGLGIVNRDLRFVRVNERLAMLNGRPVGAHVGRTVREVVPEFADQLEPLYRSVFATGTPVIELEVQGATAAQPGAVRDFRVSYVPIRDGDGHVNAVSVLVAEITEQKRLDRERLRLDADIAAQQKLQGLDTLVGGVTHDFNNLLTVIEGGLEIASADPRQPEDLRRPLETASKAAATASGICRELLVYVGRATPKLERVDLLQLVRDVVAVVRHRSGAATTIDVASAGTTPAFVDGDPMQLSQVVMNVALNAFEAIGDAPGHVQFRVAEAATGDCLVLTCADSGAGMDADTVSRVFEPFFTSKVNGRGLGLAAVASIVTRHGGTIEVTSRVGEGSVFRLTLPHARELDPAEPASGVPAPAWRGGRVLIVDDDPDVRYVSVRGVEKAGGRTLEAASAAEAWAIAEREGESVGACVVDLNMPLVDGVATYRGLRQRLPTVPILIISGHVSRDAELAVAGDVRADTVQKPIRPVHLLERLALLATAA